MSLEGLLRDLALSEVLQLLALSRRSGTLQLRAPLEAIEATIVFDQGWIVAATRTTMYGEAAASASTSGGSAGPGPETDDALSERVLDLMRWTDGEFRFVPATAPVHTGQRIPTDMLLMEAARRADAWATIGDLVPGPHSVPTFPDVEARQLSLLRLEPEQWEILTRIDGRRSIADLARTLRRDMIDIASTVHGLIAHGVLVVAATTPARASTAIPTPLSTTVIAPSAPASDIPPVYSPEMPFTLGFDGADDDSLFDPMQTGVMTPDGMPVLASGPAMSRTAAGTGAVAAGAVGAVGAVAGVSPVAGPVTTTVAEQGSKQSFEDHGGAVRNEAGDGIEQLLRAGDTAARAGDLQTAIVHWSAWLDHRDGAPASAPVRERITLAHRLLALLHQ